MYVHIVRLKYDITVKPAVKRGMQTSNHTIPKICSIQYFVFANCNSDTTFAKIVHIKNKYGYFLVAR